MKQRTLGKDGLVSSAIGFGCMGLSQGYGPTDDEQSTRVIHKALDCGVTLIDTAMSYGQGHNERLIARALAGRRAGVAIATKFGIVRDSEGVHVDARPERVRGDCEASLSRLGIETIDLYYLHRADPRVPVADTIGEMARLIEAGKVRHLGVSEMRVEQLEEAAAVHPISAVQFEWSLLWREPEHDLVPAARRLGIGIVPYSPLGRGLLTGTVTDEDIATSSFRNGDPRFHGDNLIRNRAQVEALRQIASELGATPGQLALAWLLEQAPEVVPIPATRRVERVVENVAAVQLELDSEHLRRLEEAVPRIGWVGERRSFSVPVSTRSQ